MPIKPATVRGVNIRYKMPALRPFAGFTPSWDAVLVQMEHCAEHWPAIKTEINITAKKISTRFFIILSILCKDRRLTLAKNF